ncbi:hypothetical protein [Streptomyces sp. WAC00263]|uniref:hypothetical protein n=1 Tax=Streptomyces sp. WAC00263 TaxID=1917422 RepID=UPI0015EFAEFF|nr:hypothetical protein [Streptomyces sp. WAC00263]KAF5994141.1 hypothetical protein BOG92_022560 [Streptomyces sp. WAC00263]
MTDRTSRIRGTDARTNTPVTPPRSDAISLPTPGTEALRAALSEDGYRLLGRQRHQRGTALGELADLVCITAREADRLHGKLRRHAAHVRLDNTLNPSLDPAFIPVTGLLQNTGHTTDLHAARFAQQMNQLALVLESYQAVNRTPEL